jgi:hypothetical protein
MSRLQLGIVRYASVAGAIAQMLGIEPVPECRIGQGRITVTFRSLGASRWPEADQIEHALRVADVTRAVLAKDRRRAVNRRATDRAIVVVYEDATLVRGCSVIMQWKCVVPAPS